MSYTQQADTLEELRQAFLDDLHHRVERETAQMRTERLVRDRDRLSARIVAYKEIIRLWEQVTILPPLPDILSPSDTVAKARNVFFRAMQDAIKAARDGDFDRGMTLLGSAAARLHQWRQETPNSGG